MTTRITEIVRAMCWIDLTVSPKWSWVMNSHLVYRYKEYLHGPHHHHEECLVALVSEHQHKDYEQQLKITGTEIRVNYKELSSFL